MVAWGEIGLDNYYDHSPQDVQREVFRRQIKIAKELSLPVIIHSRDANEDTVEILSQEFSPHSDDLLPESGDSDFEESSKPLAISSKRKPVGVMHCFGGTPEMADALMEIGFLISFAGNVTFKKAENLREAARVVPLDKLLVETDCPFLTPIPFRGKRNEPSFVVHTANFLADLYGVDIQKLAERTTTNFLDLFQVKFTASDTE